MAFTDLEFWAFTDLEFWTGSLCLVSTVNGPTGRTPVFGFNDEWANRANTRYTAMNVPMPCKSLIPFSFFFKKKACKSLFQLLTNEAADVLTAATYNSWIFHMVYISFGRSLPIFLPLTILCARPNTV